MKIIATCSLPVLLAFLPTASSFVAPKAVSLPPPTVIARRAISLPGYDEGDDDGVEESSKQQQKQDDKYAVQAPTKSLAKGVTIRKKWGVDNNNPHEYWFDERIHVLGNTGFLGALHAAVAPLSTKLIDDTAYGGVDIRKKLAEELSMIVGKSKARVVDLCCGVGMSTRALQNAFPDAETVLGVDTSSEMVAMAEFITKHLAMVEPFFDKVTGKMSDSYYTMKKKGYAMKEHALFKHTHFARSNAEHTNLPGKTFDLVTIMYAFHEAPREGRDAILKEARRLLSPGGTLAVVDISTDYEPSESMLAGEPYVQEYQQNIHRQIAEFPGFAAKQYKTIVPKHLGMWTLTKTAGAIA